MQAVGEKIMERKWVGNVRSKLTIRGALKTILFINTIVIWSPKQPKTPEHLSWTQSILQIHDVSLWQF